MDIPLARTHGCPRYARMGIPGMPLVMVDIWV